MKKLVQIYTELRVSPYKVCLKYMSLKPVATIYEVYRHYSYGDFIFGLLSSLSEGDAGFMNNIQKLDDRKWQASPHKTRRYIAERQDLLYIGSPHLTEKHSRKLGDCWIATNIGRVEALAIANMAAEAKGLKRSPWSDLKP